jgi:hypothetical protein
MKLHFTSGYHLEGNRQTEVNQILEQYPQTYCNYQQNHWKSLLPLVEFAYNNTLNATTDVLPFFANKGYNLSIAVHLEHNIASACAQESVTNLNELHQEP